MMTRLPKRAPAFSTAWSTPMMTSAFSPTALRAETKSSTVVVSPITKTSGGSACWTAVGADGHARGAIGDGHLADAHLLPHDDHAVGGVDDDAPVGIRGDGERLELGEKPDGIGAVGLGKLHLDERRVPAGDGDAGECRLDCLLDGACGHEIGIAQDDGDDVVVEVLGDDFLLHDGALRKWCRRSSRRWDPEVVITRPCATA